MLRSLRHLVATRLSAGKESGRLRIIGTCIVALGILAGAGYYAIQGRPESRSLDELLPGYDRARIRQTGILMGRLGVIELVYQDALARRGTQAVLIAAGALLWSLYFFRAAWVLDEEERERHARSRDA